VRQEWKALGLSNPWQALRAAKNFVKTVWDPTRADIQHGINTLVYEALAKAPPGRVAELEQQAPALAALFREGYDPALDLARFERLPDGTLGREYVRFIRENAIDPLGNLLALGGPGT
jgi:ubiquinone biosynthesis protein Coq4